MDKKLLRGLKINLWAYLKAEIKSKCPQPHTVNSHSILLCIYLFPETLIQALMLSLLDYVSSLPPATLP